MKYNFDVQPDRQGTGSLKWDRNQKFEVISGREDINSLWVADMDFPCASPIVEAIQKRAEHPVYGYTYFDGSNFFESVAAWNLKRYSRSVKKADVLYAPGVVFAVACALNAFSQPGDGVVIQTPVYYPFKKMIVNNGRMVVENPLVKDGKQYRMDFEGLAETTARSDVKLMILCSPHNPVGRVWYEDELKTVSEICESNGVLLLSDEIHSDLIRADRNFIPAASAGFADNIITLNAPSKTFNIPGLMISWVIIENDILKEKWQDEAYGRTGMSLPNPFGLAALKAAYEDSEDWLAQVVEYIDKNLLFMKEYIDENLAGVDYEVPEGTYLAWLDFNQTKYKDDEKMAELLSDDLGILVDPGFIFGEQGRGFIRINAACPRIRLQSALQKISAIL